MIASLFAALAQAAPQAAAPVAAATAIGQPNTVAVCDRVVVVGRAFSAALAVIRRR